MSTEANTMVGGGEATPVSGTTMGYCVRCKDKRDMVDARVTTSSTGRTVLQGKCPTCNTKMSRFLPNPNGTKKEKKEKQPRKKKQGGAEAENGTEPRSPEENEMATPEASPVEENNQEGGKKAPGQKKPTSAKKKAPRKKKAEKAESSDV